MVTRDSAAHDRITTTTHRPRCDRPGWAVTSSGGVQGVSVARCLGCGAVELRQTSEERTS